MRAERLLAVLLAGGALAAGGCGGDGDVDELGSGADVAPAATAFFAAVATDMDGEQWQKAEALVDRFPSGREALGRIADELAREGLDFERDVVPALGPEVDLVAFAGTGDGDEQSVALTQPPDEAKLRALVEKSDELVYEMVDDWAVIAEDRAAIDAFADARGDESLADTDAWKEATDGLPEGALVAGFANAAGVSRELSERGGESAELFDALRAGGGAPAVGFALRAEDDGVRLDADMPLAGDEEPDEYEASLPSALPAGALAYVSWNDAAKAVRQALRRAGDENAELDRYVAQAELALGLSLERDLFPLLEGEGALALYPGETRSPAEQMPLATLVLAVDEEERALATLDRIVERASSFVDSVKRVGDVDVGGVRAHAVVLEEGVTLLYAAADGKLVLGTGRDAVAGVFAGGDKLADDPAFANARELAGAPDETAGFAYVNLGAVSDLAARGASPKVEENLEPLGPLFVHATVEDGEVAVDGFLALD